MNKQIPATWAAALAKGWKIVPCFCTCGGKYAWLKPRTSGAFEMHGCVCHNDPEFN